MKIQFIVPTTVMCLIPWMIADFPHTTNWTISFTLCIAIDLVYYGLIKK